MKSWHFDFGNSSEGPVGYCAVVHAATKAEAVAKLKATIPEDQEVEQYNDDDDIEYITVYFNEAAITEANVTEWE